MFFSRGSCEAGPAVEAARPDAPAAAVDGVPKAGVAEVAGAVVPAGLLPNNPDAPTAAVVAAAVVGVDAAAEAAGAAPPKRLEAAPAGFGAAADAAVAAGVVADGAVEEANRLDAGAELAVAAVADVAAGGFPKRPPDDGVAPAAGVAPPNSDFVAGAAVDAGLDAAGAAEAEG